jgi:hypothetical protein
MRSRRSDGGAAKFRALVCADRSLRAAARALPGWRFRRTSAWRASHSLSGGSSTMNSDCPAECTATWNAVATARGCWSAPVRARRDDAGEIERIRGAQ